MLVENAALYRQHPVSVKLPWLTLLSLVLCVCCAGCPSANKPTKPAQDDGTESPVPSVPLRVWFVADPSDKPVIERQWEATYDRPVEVTIFTAEEMLKQTKPACDVLVYPAWMLGDVVTRGWLTELPSKLQNQEPETEGFSAPASWIEQSRFNRKLWGLSLSVLPTMVMANFELPKAREVGPNESATVDEAIAYWQSLAEALKTARAAATTDVSPAEREPVAVDAQAVCDRYLTILFSVSNSDNTIGALFHPEDLRPRVGNANFALSAKIMHDLHASGASDQALLGSHSAAWNALTAASPDVTIALPPAPSEEADKINSINVSQPPANPARSGSRISAGWNSGRGLLVSISKQCRQSSTSIDFASWLASDASRQVFSRRIVGINAETSYAPGSSAWQAQRIVQRLGQQTRLPSEPRLPHSLAYRQALGEQIASVIQGQKTIEAALADIDKAWQEITAQSDRTIQVPAYVQSLGL